MALFTLVIIQSCEKDEAPIVEEVEEENPMLEENLTNIVNTSNSSFEIIQRLTFNKSCAVSGCHISATTSNGELDLTAEVSYASLVNAPIVASPLANDRGFKLVTPNDVEKSFLVTKINCFGEQTPDHHDYGFPMPLSRPNLSQGEVDFILSWINAGAPQSGKVADTDLLDQIEVLDCGSLPDFVAPDPPAQGYQLSTGMFPIQPGSEREIFIYKSLPNTEMIYVNRLEMIMRPSTHHFLAYVPRSSNDTPVEDQIRDIESFFDLAGPFVSTNYLGGTQIPNDELVFPQGVALPINPGVGVDLNSHYTNYTSHEIVGEAFLNLHTVDQTEVQHIAKTIFMGETVHPVNFRFVVPANSEFIIDEKYSISNDTARVINLVSHTHRLGTTFDMFHVKNDGSETQIYANSDWEHPETKYFDPPLILLPNEKIRTVAKYLNTSDQDVIGGIKSYNEMHLILGYYF